jgi:hypothetical protein
LAIVFAGLCAVVWYLPYFALLCVVVAAAFGLIDLLGRAFVKWFEHSSERVQWREHFLTVARDVFGILFPLALAIATAIGIWIWYPFKPIADVPLARITLNQIFTDFFGAFLLSAVPAVILSRWWRDKAKGRFHTH